MSLPDEPNSPPESPDAAPHPASADRTVDAAIGRSEPSFPIVGIGASAGGLEALEALLRRLSKGSMAYVVFQHLAPGHDSLLTEILARAAAIKVETIVDNVPVEPNKIYVTPPGVDVTLSNGVLHLKPSLDRGARHPIDAFFTSLAADCGTHAIGVILSGAGTDGTFGLRNIKDEGGITFVQQPGTAAQSSMPQSAVDSGCADFCLAPGDIGDELMRLSAHPFVARKRPSGLFDPNALARIFEQLRRRSGVDFSKYKLSTIERRIERRMALQKLERADDYARLVEANIGEMNALYGDLLIGVTSFFRDAEPFETLKSVVFPRLVEHREPTAPIRIWVAGCASGEEAYSIAICLLEFFDTRPPGFPIQIFATDIDEDALNRARQGLYPHAIELDVSPARLQRFFARTEAGYLISRPVRDMVVFARHNVARDPPFSRLDLVSCRNVLIYLQQTLQKRVLRVFHYALNPDAYLLLGTSESVGEAAGIFSLLEPGVKIYLKKNTPSTNVFEFGQGLRVEGTLPLPAFPRPVERRPVVSLQQLADRTVLDKYGPPGVLLDENLEVVQFRGQTARFLAPAPGNATLNILKLIRPELLAPLRIAVRRVLDDRRAETTEPIRAPTTSDRTITLDLIPVQPSEGGGRFVLILFRESTTPIVLEPGTVAEHARLPGAESRAEELERELLTTKEYLQTTIQDIEGANEVLQTTVEELQSSNEELQSTNEELETSKEELQSTNEELATVNEELSNRMTQLNLANDDLENILANVGAPMVIVGMDLRIRRFSAAAATLLSLLPSDVGRPVSYLGVVLSVPALETAVGDSIGNVRAKSQRVRCSDGLMYTMRVAPYRTADHAIRGAIIEFTRGPVIRKPGEPVEIHELAGKVLSTLPHILMLLDEDLHLVWVNKSFFETFAVGAEILGRSLDEVWRHREPHERIWQLLEDARTNGKPFENEVVDHPFGRASDVPMRFSARFVAAEADRPALVLVVMEETSRAVPPP